MDAERTINEQPLSNLPERVKGNHCKKWKMNDIQTNYYYVTLAAIERIFVYSVKFNPSLPADNTKQRLELLKAASQISDNIVNPVLTSSNIFSLAPPKQDLFEVPSGNFRITIKKVKVIEPKNNGKVDDIDNQKIEGPHPYPWPFGPHPYPWPFPLPFPEPCPPNPNPKFEGAN